MTFSIALAQIDPVLGDLDKNVARHVSLAKRAVNEGAQLIVFPELSLTGYSVKDMNWDLALNVSRLSPSLSSILELSQSISILAGGIEEDDAFHLHNAALLFEGGVMSSAHRKTYPPNYGMFEELRYFSPGRDIHINQSRLGSLGVLICEDLWHLSLPYLLALQGAQIIIAMAASPTRMAGGEQNLRIASTNAEHHRTYARLLSCYIAFCNRVGFEDGVNFWGGSEVVGPDGSIIVAAKQFEEDLVIARIDDSEVRRARQLSRHFLDENPSLVLRELERIHRS